MNKTRIISSVILISIISLHFFAPENDTVDFIKGMLTGGTIAFFITKYLKK